MKRIKIISEFILRDIPIHLINLITSLLPNHLIVNRLRGFLISFFLGKCGKRMQVGRGVIINNPGKLYVGDDCYLSHNCYVQAKGTVILGNDVIIGPMSVIASSKHRIEDSVPLNKGTNEPIIIGNNFFCGSHTTILAGINIGSNIIIGAGSIITKNIKSNTKVFENKEYNYIENK